MAELSMKRMGLTPADLAAVHRSRPEAPSPYVPVVSAAARLHVIDVTLASSPKS